MFKYVLGFAVTALCVATVFAFPHLFGYSGAPGSRGSCAASCHGSAGGTIQVAGFPSEYMPESTYTITVSHAGGDPIKQFNGSCRIGVGSEAAGIISAGTNTFTYSVAQETNGVHFISADQDNGTFFWTAPPAGTGEVTLYIAGLQGGYTGLNTALTQTSTEASCCIMPIRGNIDYGQSELIDITDLVYLVDYMFNNGTAPPCEEEANVDALGGIDISDLVYLVDYMFTGGLPPAPCP